MLSGEKVDVFAFSLQHKQARFSDFGDYFIFREMVVTKSQ
jgi:hypothetical protein